MEQWLGQYPLENHASYITQNEREYGGPNVCAANGQHPMKAVLELSPSEDHFNQQFPMIFST